jgi:hypothetical protein
MPEMEIASHDVGCLEWSAQGVESASADRQDSSFSSAAAAPADQSGHRRHKHTVKLTRLGKVKDVLDLIRESGDRVQDSLEEMGSTLQVRGEQRPCRRLLVEVERRGSVDTRREDI